MEINEKNKELYESAFIPDGKYAVSGDSWKPSIDEREINESCEDENGNWVPATPLGFRDYKISRLEGLSNILDKGECVNLSDDKFHHVKRGDDTIKLYDRIMIDGEREFVVVGDSDEVYYLADKDNKIFCVRYESIN